MTPEESAQAAAPAVSGLATAFMFDAATYTTGGELGFQGIDFYFAGRGGALGEVDADVVSASLVFFNPDTVRAAWDNSRPVLPRSESADHFAAAAARWADDHLGDGCDWARLAELAGRVAASASPMGAPLFALAGPGGADRRQAGRPPPDERPP